MLSTISISPELQSQHRWFLRMQTDNEDASIETFTTLFRSFARLGDAGAFVASGSNGRNCVMQIVHEDRVGNDAMEFLVDVANCDQRYARPLRNAVFAFGEILECPIVEFRVDSVSGSHAGTRIEAEVDPNQVMAGDFYPVFSTELGVQIEKTVPSNYRSGRRLSFSCTNELSLQLVEELIELGNLWISVLVCAYPNSEVELQDGETMILNVEGSQHDELTFEVLVDRFIASESAFASFLNLLIIRVNRENVVSKVVLE